MEIYTVKQGDNVDQIASQAGVPAERIIRDNQIEYPYRLAVGQALLIRNGTENGAKRPLEVNGYAYPFIQSGTLSDTLPYLTELSVFSYGFTVNGDLIPPMVDDSYMIHRALDYGARPVLTLTPIGADGQFNNNLATVLVENRRVQQRLIWELGRTMSEKGYEGVDIDFEYVLAEDRVGYADFVSTVRSVMNPMGYLVTAALAPKTSRDQKGLLYEGIDYGLLGEAADKVMLMTYEWGYTYEPTGYR